MKLELFGEGSKMERTSNLEESLAQKMEAEEKAALFEDQDLHLTEDEKHWFREKTNEADKNGGYQDISFKASASCISGTVGCTGCAGILIDSKIGCRTGACSSGTTVKN